MNKAKLLTIAVIGLLLLNLGLVTFLVLSGRKEKGDIQEGKRMPREIIIEKLHFSEHQTREYEKLIQWHRNEIETLETTIRATKNELYQQLNRDVSDSAKKDSLILILANCQKQIEITHFKHFEDIKKLCTKEQMNDFTVLTEELSKIFSKPRPSKRD